jgi:uncharacterized protein with PIN domain
MQVIDASAVVDLLVRTPRGERVAARLAEDPGSMVPELVYVEVASAVHGLRAGSWLPQLTTDARLARAPLPGVTVTLVQ